jgi:hypothetical protein
VPKDGGIFFFRIWVGGYLCDQERLLRLGSKVTSYLCCNLAISSQN